MASQTYAGFTRFELELEVCLSPLPHHQPANTPKFVQLLGNPWYLNHLASHNVLDKPEFVAYLDYLQYWRQAAYAQFLSYPGPSLRALELLQQPKFRAEIVRPVVMGMMMEEGIRASVG
jgi:mediator of RNA polymerase II transcription subunit 31